MHTSANIIANFISKFWGFISMYVFSRIFLSLLGPELYGILSFYTLLFGIAAIADAGFSATLNREFARPHKETYLKQILLLSERAYAVICVLVGLVIFFFAESIATNWLSYDSLTVKETAMYVQVIAVIVSTQLMAGIYTGALMGSRMQVSANAIQLSIGMLKTIGGVAVLYIFSKNLHLFLIWQVAGNLLQLILLRRKIMGHLKISRKVFRLKWREVDPELWKYMGGMTLIAVLSAITIQSDKLVASKYLELSGFAFYSLASVLSQIAIFIVIPVVTAIFPSLVRSFSSGEYDRLYKIYQRVSFILLTVVFSIGAILCLYGGQIFELWISSRNMDSAPNGIGTLILFLSLGNVLQAAQYMPFQLLIAQGRTKFTIYQAVTEMVFLIPLLLFFVERLGFVGLGIPWFLVKLLGYIYLCIVVHKLKPISIKINYNKTIIQPFLITCVISIAIYLASESWFHHGFLVAFPAMAVLVISGVVNLYFFDRRYLTWTGLKNALRF